MDASWTISELCERVADALAASGDVPGGTPSAGSSSRRARAIPDERSVRYYTTLGLIDRPTLRGRTAYYGGRHLAQLVAIKKMQADGATLAEIQELLPAIDDARLSELTGIAIGERERPAGRRDFWRGAAATPAEPDAGTDLAAPSAAGPGAGPAVQAAAASGSSPASDVRAIWGGPKPAHRASASSLDAEARGPSVPATAAAAVPPAFTAEHHLELAPGVRLCIHASREPTDADADALRVAAAAVLAELARRRLVTSPPGRQP